MCDLWTKNESLFRKLYQEERKTLSQVKETVESEPYFFPRHPISVYETRLRDVLKLRKKLKKEDWKSIHDYATSQKLLPGNYDVFLNGTQIPMKRVWKEIRRNGYHHHHHATSGASLPKDVQVQPRGASNTVQGSALITPRLHSHSEGGVVSIRNGKSQSGQSLQTWDAFRAALRALAACEDATRDTSRGAIADFLTVRHGCKAKLIDMTLESLPWNQFRITVLECMFQQKVTYEFLDPEGFPFLHMPSDGFLPLSPSMVFARLADTIYPPRPASDALLLQSAKGTSDQLILHQMLASTLFRITDRYFSELSDFAEFGLILQHMRPDIVSQIIRMQSSVLRAVWDKFVRALSSLGPNVQWCSVYFDTCELHRRSFDVVSLIGACTGIVHIVLNAHPDWVDAVKDELLSICAWLGSSSLVLNLLARGARPLRSRTEYFPELSPFIHATLAGSADTIESLLGFVDINAPTPVITRPIGVVKTSHFSFFIYYFLFDQKFQNDDRHYSHFFRALRILLESGANVDAPCAINLNILGAFVGHYDPSPDLYPSCLDIAFYCDHEAFKLMSEYSSREAGALTRVGVSAAALATGTAGLDEYVKSKGSYHPEVIQKFLAVMLLEQSAIEKRRDAAYIDADRTKVLRVLLEYGAEVGVYRYDPDAASAILRVSLRTVREYGLTDDLQVILHLLSRRPIPISGELLGDCVEEEGTTLLAMLKRDGLINKLDVTAHGRLALVAAARFENSDALSWLAEMGADMVGDGDNRRSILGDCMENRLPMKIWRHLIQLGAKLRYQSSDRTCVELLTKSLEKAYEWAYYDDSRFLEAWHFFESFPAEMNQLSSSEWRAVARSLCNNRRWRPIWKPSRPIAPVIDEILRRGAEPGRCPSLVLTIAARRCSDIRALLSNGCDINELDEGFTPLQMAITTGDLRLAREIINLGADVNIASCIGYGRGHSQNALSLLAALRDQRECLETMKLLLSKGATVTDSHVQPHYQPWFRPPLLLHVLHGGLEAVTLLLQDADPNSVTIVSFEDILLEWNHKAKTALDYLVVQGRLDMTQLLLKAGALSANPGITGYDGAISAAMDRGQQAIAGLIRQRIHDLDQIFKEHPHSRLLHQQRIEVLQAESEDLLQRARDGEDLLIESKGYGCWWMYPF